MIELKKTRRKQTEHTLQSQCIKWFRLQYPLFKRLLFAVPNGAKRDVVSGRRYKEEGMVAGVSDCILLVAGSEKSVYDCSVIDLHGLCIEFKTKKGRQTDHQKAFEDDVKWQGYGYWIINDFDDFVKKINKYMDGK